MLSTTRNEEHHMSAFIRKYSLSAYVIAAIIGAGVIAFTPTPSEARCGIVCRECWFSFDTGLLWCSGCQTLPCNA